MKNKKHDTVSAVKWLNNHHMARLKSKDLKGVLELYLDANYCLRCRRDINGRYEDSHIPIGAMWVEEEY